MPDGTEGPWAPQGPTLGPVQGQTDSWDRALGPHWHRPPDRRRASDRPDRPGRPQILPRFGGLARLSIEPDVDARVRILHEDEAFAVVNKPAPLPMHAGGRFFRNTLQEFLNAAYAPIKPKPVHRIDANTTGLVLVALHPVMVGRLQSQFTSGQVEKRYLVRVQGHPEQDSFFCEAPISRSSGPLGSRDVDFESGLPARTGFLVIHRSTDGSALLEARPFTGRTNQIRVHLWHLGLPVRGDAAYLPNGRRGETQTLAITDPPLCLHAWKLSFHHPVNEMPASFCAPLPPWASLDNSTSVGKWLEC